MVESSESVEGVESVESVESVDTRARGRIQVSGSFFLCP